MGDPSSKPDWQAHNRLAWNRESRAGGVWSVAVDAATIAAAREDRWSVVLTPKKPVPRAWFDVLDGADVLCLASGGGQQAPVLAAAGARVLSFDLSEEQLSKDRGVAARDGLDVVCVQGDMRDLRCLPDASFDLVFHPVSNLFVPDVSPVWRECHRVLRPGGRLLAGFMHPALWLFDHDAADAGAPLEVRYRLPYDDVSQLPPDRLADRLAGAEPLEHSHSLEAQIGGQLAAGFVLAGLYEDGWLDASWVYARHAPVAVATLAVKPPLAGPARG
jgi:SAM-dependent methyltransferase